MNSKELFDAIRSSKIKFSDALNKQNEFLKKLNDVKIGKKNLQQKEVIDKLTNYNVKQNETKGKGLKILTPKKMLPRLPIALAQVKSGNNSENLLNEIRQII